MCPACQSDFLMIKKLEGFERLVVLLTEKRKYKCRDCDTNFRAPDRRRVPRETQLNVAGTRVGGVSLSPGWRQ